MGYIRHHAIVVTGNDDTIEEARQAAIDAGCVSVTNVAHAKTNGYASFLVAPDGSKEGWDTSDEGDAARGRFIDWLNSASRYFSWAEVVLGSDDGVALIARNAWSDDDE